MQPLRIVYVGPLTHGGTCLQRMIAMRELGVDVIPVDTYPPAAAEHEKTFASRVCRRFFGQRDLAGANDRILDAARSREIDALWIDKGRTIKPHTLAAVRRLQPKCRIVGYSPDDMAARHNQSAAFRAGLPLYDVYFTTKTYGVNELKALGCPHVEFVGNAFDRNVHRPLPVTPDDRRRLGGAVGFIGDFEEERARSMAFLARNGVPVRIWGGNWDRSPHQDPNLILERKYVWADDYARALCAFDVNLCFLRKMNRDRQTQRSVEIPACGAFMLAERTDEHLALFDEGKEAAFFSTDEELLAQVRYYLQHDSERAAIAEAGRQRCLRSGYSNHDRIMWMLGRIRELDGPVPAGSHR